MNEISFETFSRVFRENLIKRSRTAKGTSDISSSTKKRKLLKEGEELVRQVGGNTTRLIESVWESHRLSESLRKAQLIEGVQPNELRQALEKWYDIINFGLQPEDAYREEGERLAVEAERMSKTTELPYRINKRYRVWEVAYTTLNLKPVELELAMDDFYKKLSWKMEVARVGAAYKPEILAWADLAIDGEIHPWADGCGRHATAVVMWLSLLAPPEGLPIFETREEHYGTIRNLSGHMKYYERCLDQYRKS